jgi:pyridoxine kinase
VFVRPGIPEFMREQAVRAADIVTPNQFELDLLSGRGSATRREALAAIDAVHALGPKAILVTSLHTDETPADAIDLVASDASGRVRVRTPKLPISINGAGDAIAALFFAHYLRTSSAAEALSRAASSIFGLLKRTADAGSREILLIDAQDEFVTPSRVFAAEKI